MPKVARSRDWHSDARCGLEASGLLPWASPLGRCSVLEAKLVSSRKRTLGGLRGSQEPLDDLTPEVAHTVTPAALYRSRQERASS